MMLLMLILIKLLVLVLLDCIGLQQNIDAPSLVDMRKAKIK